MRNKKGDKGWMAIKIDLKKAYHRFNWTFLKDTSVDIGLSENMINVIWHCVTSPSMRLLWNEERKMNFLL